MTTRTSSRASATAFVDELTKIAAAKAPSEKKGKLKRWLKNSALVAAGTGLGTGAYMVAEKGVGSKFGKRWSSLHPNTRRGIAGAGAGAATVGGLLLASKLAKERAKADE